LKGYCLPVELRDELRQLHGELYPGDGIETTKKIIHDLQNCTKVISVGDIVTFNLLNAGLIPEYIHLLIIRQNAALFPIKLHREQAWSFQDHNCGKPTWNNNGRTIT